MYIGIVMNSDNYNGKNVVVSLSSLLPAASIIKNKMTLYTLFIVLIAMAIAFPLFYTKSGLFDILANLGHLKQPLFVYAVVFYILAMYFSCYALISEEMVWSKDDNLRNQFISPVCLIFCACLIIYMKEKESEVELWDAVVCEVLGRQILAITTTAFNVFYAKTASDKFYSAVHSEEGKLKLGKIIAFYLLTAFVMLLTSFIYTILLAVVILPLSLSFLNLNEIERLGIYGFLFPVARYLYCLLLDHLLIFLKKNGVFHENPQGLTSLKFHMSFNTALFFAVSPLFCMLFLSPDPLSFAITYIPHAFFSKIIWARRIPQIKTFFANLGKRRVLVVNQMNQSNADMITSTHDKILSEKDRSKIEEYLFISNSAGIQESADLVGIKTASILMVMRLCFLCFYLSDGSNVSAISFDQFKNLLINVFCVILPIDQISAIFGFALLAQSGYPVDANFHLDVNPLNPIEVWRSGNRFKAFGSFSVLAFVIY